jgi:hypothetical protein
MDNTRSDFRLAEVADKDNIRLGCTFPTLLLADNLGCVPLSG